MRAFLIAPLLLSVASCAAMAPPPESASAACPVLDNRNWHAWVDRMPGPDAQVTLNISGQVDLPTPGYSVSLRAGPMDRAMPPGQSFELVATPPGGIVTQVVTPADVRYREPTVHQRYRRIVIGCGGTVLATIPDVTITE